MPDIDPASLHRPDTLQTSLNPSALSLSKPNALSTTAPAPKASKVAVATGPQRVDIEPIYTSLKAAIGERWLDYKKALGKFIIGQLKQSELELRIDYFITASPEIEHLHNTLITAIYANAYREPPEPGVAPWVAANDKPVGSIGGGGVGKGGDKIEERLRREVMLLPGRDRRRLKEVGERDPYDAHFHAMNDYRLARSIKLPDNIPASAGGLNKTNWDLEIRKRYTHPLFHETLEFPDAPTIANRMLPICYEEALPNGPSDQCAEFMATAAEMFVKDVVGSVLSLTRSNLISAGAKSGIVTKNRSRGVDRGAKKGSKAGTEAAGAIREEGGLGTSGQPPLGISDLRVALSIAACSLGPMPDVVTDIMGGWPEGVLEDWETFQPDDDEDAVPLDLDIGNGISLTSTTDEQQRKISDAGKAAAGSAVLLANGVGGAKGPGNSAAINGNATSMEEPAVPEWAGSSYEDRERLFGLLDQCLSVGQ